MLNRNANHPSSKLMFFERACDIACNIMAVDREYLFTSKEIDYVETRQCLLSVLHDVGFSDALLSEMCNVEK